MLTPSDFVFEPQYVVTNQDGTVDRVGSTHFTYPFTMDPLVVSRLGPL